MKCTGAWTGEWRCARAYVQSSCSRAGLSAAFAPSFPHVWRERRAQAAQEAGLQPALLVASSAFRGSAWTAQTCTRQEKGISRHKDQFCVSSLGCDSNTAELHRECGNSRAANVHPSAAGFFCSAFTFPFVFFLAFFLFLPLFAARRRVEPSRKLRLGFRFCCPTCKAIASPKCEYHDDRLH